MMRILVMVILFCFSSLAHFAQNVKEDMYRLNSGFVTTKGLSFDVTYNAYINYTASTPLKVDSGHIDRLDQLMRQRIGTMEQVYGRDYFLSVDHDDKRILIAPLNNKKTGKEMLDKIFVNFDSIISKCQKVEYKSTSKSSAMYSLQFNSGEYERLDIAFDKDNYRIRKMVLYYRNNAALDENRKPENVKPRLEIVFGPIKYNQKLSKNDFSYDHYLVKKGKGFIGNEKYKGYEIRDAYTK